jgi:hypothetical protein
MAKKKNRHTDDYSSRIEELLADRYKAHHPRAKIKAYRYNPASVRVRILDPDFADKLLFQREEEVWKILKTLPEHVLGDVSMVLLLTPEESRESLANVEFEDPTPSLL